MLHGDLLGERARLSPEKTALVFVPTGERFTYRDLEARAALAAAVRSAFPRLMFRPNRTSATTANRSGNQ